MRSEADDGRPETSPDTGARRNSPNKDSSSKKLSNTPLPIHVLRLTSWLAVETLRPNIRPILRMLDMF